MSGLDDLPLSISAYIADTQHLSLPQHGAYLLILMSMRRAGGWIADDDRKIALICKTSIAKWRQIAPDVRALLIVRDGKLTQKRILSDVEKTLKTVHKNRQNGSAGGKAKSLKSKRPDLATARVSPPDRHTGKDSALTSFFGSSESQKETRKKASSGIALPADWTPSPREIEYGIGLGLNRSDIDRFAEDMRVWAHGNSNRAVARKADWPSAFKGWMRREADKRKPKQSDQQQPRSRNAFLRDMADRHKDEEIV